VDVEGYRRLIGDAPIKLYPGFDSHGEGGTGRLVPAKKWREAWFRGLAYGYYRRGADGIHIFNWHGTVSSHRPLLTTIGSPKTLEGVDKVYSSLKRLERPKSEPRYGAERDDRLAGEVPVKLYRTLTGTGPTFHLAVHDDRPPGSVAFELHVELDHFSPADRVRVVLDGRDLPEPQITNTAAVDAGNPSDVTESSWLVWKLEPAMAAKGVHALEIVLIERDERIKSQIAVLNVEIWAKHA